MCTAGRYLVLQDVTQMMANKRRKIVYQSQRTRGFNVKNPLKVEGKNYGRQPVNLHSIECGYRTSGIYNHLNLISNGGLQEVYIME